MEHVSYGLFPDDAHARAAIDAIEASGTERRHCGVAVHRQSLEDDEIHVLESGAGEGARFGAALGGALGAVSGGVLLGPGSIIIGGALGALYGVVTGALSGVGAPDRKLDELEKHLKDGKVLVIVEAPSLTCRERADSAMKEHEGEIFHKPFF